MKNRPSTSTNVMFCRSSSVEPQVTDGSVSVFFPAALTFSIHEHPRFTWPARQYPLMATAAEPFAQRVLCERLSQVEGKDWKRRPSEQSQPGSCRFEPE